MTETAHTPGPWEACERGDYRDDGIVIIGDDMRVAVVNRDEDAPLIAAAPAMLAVLKECRDLAELAATMTGCRSDDEYVWGIQAKIDAAISAATPKEG